MNRSTFLAALGSVALLLAGRSSAWAEGNEIVLHVAADAKAGGDGSSQEPLTLEEAPQVARAHAGQPVRVELAGGHYLLRNGWTLTSEDSGAPDRPIRYEAAPGATARLSSGAVVPADAFQSVTDPALLDRLDPAVRGKVKRVSLSALGIQTKPFEDNFFGVELLEVSWNGKRLPLARWPGKGGYAKMAKVIDNGLTAKTRGAFLYNEDEPGRWSAAVAEGLWLRGFWRVPWVIEGVKVGQIDPATKTITLAGHVSGGIGSKYNRGKDGTGPGSGAEPWEAINLIEAIRTPGDWAVRFADQSLYICLPDEPGELLLSDCREPVVALKGVSHVSLERLDVDSGLGDGIRVTGGEGVLIAGCRVTNVARDGISLQGGSHHTVLSCDTAETGLSGIAYLGGERRTLTPGGHRILNNLIRRAGLYYPAPGINGGLKVKAEAVGNLIAYNRIHDCSNSGIVYAGNDNVFEYNEIYRIGLGSSDLGCFYTNAGWTSRGNLIRYNFVHHSMNANAFYVDDGDCGDTFLSNIVYQTQTGGFVSGGHDQTFRHNLFIDATRAMHVDARGIPRRYTATDARLRGDLDSVPHTQPPWSTKYPELVHFLDQRPEVPTGIVVEENLLVRCATPIRRAGKPEELAAVDAGVRFENNVTSDDLGIFANPDAFDFALKPDAPVLASLPQFELIPTGKIGLYPDAYRPTVPERDMELLRTGNTARGFDSQTDMEASNKKQ
jgi:hypothetical protein